MNNKEDKTKIISILDNIFAKINGYEISSSYRDKIKINSKSMTYGEIKFSDFAKILDQCEPIDGKIFYDLGCGTGRACFLVGLLYNFKKIIGIELIIDLYLTANQLKEEIQQINSI